MFVFPRRLDQLSRFHRWVDLALLFAKGVGREIAVLEVADNVFSNVQHSRNPVLKLCGRRTAGDLSQSTILRPELFPGGSVFAACKRTLHCYNFVVPRRWRKLRSRSSHVTKFLRDLLASVAPKKNNESKQNGSNLQVLLNKVRTLGCKSSLKRQTQGRLEGDR